MYFNMNIYSYLKLSPDNQVSSREGKKENLENAPGECSKEVTIRPKKTYNYFMVHLPKTLEDTRENVPEYL